MRFICLVAIATVLEPVAAQELGGRQQILKGLQQQGKQIDLNLIGNTLFT